MGSAVDGGHRLTGTWPSAPEGVSLGDWTVVRASLPPPGAPDAPPVPYLHAVHTRRYGLLADAQPQEPRVRRGARLDEFVPAGLMAPVAPSDRTQDLPGDALLVGSVSMSLGIAAAVLERAKSARARRPEQGRAREELLLVEQQLADVELAVLDASHRLRVAVEDHEQASASQGSDGGATEAGSTRKALAEVMRSAAHVTQLVVAFAYEFSLDSDGAPVEEDIARIVTGAAPALQHSRFAGEFLELGSD